MGNYLSSPESSQNILEEKLCKSCYLSHRVSRWMKDGYGSHGLESIPDAVHRGHPQCLAAIIKADAVMDNNKRKSICQHGLVTATSRGNIACVTMLVEAGADVNKYSHGETPLVTAAKGGHEECLEFFLSKGADVNACDKYDSTALDYAVRHGNEACLNLLIKAGADVNSIKVNWFTTLMEAVRCGNTKCISSLIEAGADVNAKDIRGSSAITIAAERKISCQNFQLLISAGADVNVVDKKGNTPLIIAGSSIVTGRVECVKLLLRSGAKVNLLNNSKKKALCSHIDIYKRKYLRKPPDRTMVLLLYAAGEILDGITIDEDDNNNSCLLDYLDKREICLKVLCREAIKKTSIGHKPSRQSVRQGAEAWTSSDTDSVHVVQHVFNRRRTMIIHKFVRQVVF